jgi:hypothetical protein
MAGSEICLALTWLLSTWSCKRTPRLRRGCSSSSARSSLISSIVRISVCQEEVLGLRWTSGYAKPPRASGSFRHALWEKSNTCAPQSRTNSARNLATWLKAQSDGSSQQAFAVLDRQPHSCFLPARKSAQIIWAKTTALAAGPGVVREASAADSRPCWLVVSVVRHDVEPGGSP